jgi:hypothetical protein
MKMVILDDEDGVLSESSMWSLLVVVFCRRWPDVLLVV